MADSEEKIREDMRNYISRCGGSYPSWYVGISEDPRDRLFNQHKVHEKNGGSWIFRWASSTDVARRIESYFIDLGTDGAPGGGDVETTAVYAYKKASYTDP